MEEEEYLKEFESRLTEALVRQCSSCGLLDSQLLENDDIEEKFTNSLAREYFTDALREFVEYPEVSLAWAGYMGMAMARFWDKDIHVFNEISYGELLGKRGFDDMDEHIVNDILGFRLDSPQSSSLAELMSRCAAQTLSLIRHEGVEPQSPRAFYIFARAVQVMYRIGASVELRSLGYKWERLGVTPPLS